MIRYTLLLLFSLLIACEKSNLNSSSDSAERPVVESFLQPGANPVVYVRKQILYGSNDTLQQPIINLSVQLESVDDGLLYPLQHSDSSAYIADGSWRPQYGHTYRLRFVYNGEEISAETYVPFKPEGFSTSASSIQAFDPDNLPGSGGPPSFPDPIELTWDAGDGSYYLVVVETAETNPELIFSDTTRFRPFRAFRSAPVQTNLHRLDFMSFRYYGVHNVILYRLNAEYAALYESYGNNSTNLSTPYTNINGGLGIFTGMSADTIQITVTE